MAHAGARISLEGCWGSADSSGHWEMPTLTAPPGRSQPCATGRNEEFPCTYRSRTRSEQTRCYSREID